MKKCLVPLATGFEEIEAVAVVDILRRAGTEVVTAGTVKGAIEGRNKIKVVPDVTLDAVLKDSFDVIFLPGGAVGTENLKKDARIKEIVEGHFAKGKLVAAICAAPSVLSKIGVTKGRTITSHPGVRAELVAGKVSDERVVADGNIITSQGPGTAIEFAFKLVEILYGMEKVKEINKVVLARL